MADSILTELPSLTAARRDDPLYIVSLHENLSGDSMQITVSAFFSQVDAPANFLHECTMLSLSVTTTLEVDGATDLGSTLDVAGATNLNNTLTVDGATVVDNTLVVTGLASIQNDLRVTNTATVTGATTLNNTLDVYGATTLNTSLAVLSVANLSDNLNVVGAVDITGHAVLSGGMDVTGVSYVSDLRSDDAKSLVWANLISDAEYEPPFDALSRIIHFDTDTAPNITFKLPGDLTDGFNIGFFNVGSGTVTLSAALPLFATSTTNSVQYTGAYAYKMFGAWNVIGRLD